MASAQFVEMQRVIWRTKAVFPPPVWLRALAEREIKQIAKSFRVCPAEMMRPYYHRHAKYLLARRLNRAYPHPSIVARALGVELSTYAHWVEMDAEVSASEVKT